MKGKEYLLVFCAFLNYFCKASPPSLRDLRSQIKWDNGYNKYRASSWYENTTAEIQVGLFIETLSSITALDMDFDVDMYVMQAWNDSRLAHNNSRYLIISDAEIIKSIWRPDLFFANSKKTFHHQLTTPNVQLKVYPNGRIYYEMRVSGTFSCELTLHMYPNDVQTCTIRMMSYAYTTRELQYYWFRFKPIQLNKGLNLPEMDIRSTNASYCRATYVEQSHYDLDGTKETFEYSCLEAKIIMQRRLGYHLAQTYLPSSLIVAVSWASFWIDPHAAPARTTLSVTTLLTITTQAASIRQTLPQVSYVKAIDYWMAFCSFMIALTLVEYAIVNFHLQKSNILYKLQAEAARKRKQKENAKHQQSVGHDLDNLDAERDYIDENTSASNNNGSTETSENELADKEFRCKRRAFIIEKVSRVAFPSLFFLLTAIYWACLLGIKNEKYQTRDVFVERKV